MRIQSQLALFWLLVLGAGLMLEGCADSGPSGPTFRVSFDSTLARSNGGDPTRVELYLVDDCESVPMGARAVPAIATAEVVRDGPGGAFEQELPLGSFGLYGVAQDDDCAVVAAGCTSVTINESTQALSITLSRYDMPGCPSGQFCSRQTGECSDEIGGTGGMSGTSGSGGMSGGGGSGASSGSGGAGGSTSTRITDGLLALYDFDENGGSTVFDQSGVSPPLDLSIDDVQNVTWSPGHLSIDTGTAIRSAGAATKIFSGIRSTNAMSLEAWVRPSTLVVTGTAPDRIVTMSDSASRRNFLLGQDATEYAGRYRIEGANNGDPTVYSTAGTARLELTHVIFTHEPDGTEVFYINGEKNSTTSRPGGTSTWDATYPLVIANEATPGREWLGELHLVAIYERALTEEEARQNFDAGP